MRFLFALFLFISISSVWNYESLNDFEMSIDFGDYVFQGALYDQNSGRKYFLEEIIHVDFMNKHGKISIISDSKSQIDVFYSLLEPKARVVMQDYECDHFQYLNGWDKTIEGIENSLVNHILLVGPSLIYRFQGSRLAWQKGADDEIRGTTMHSAYTSIGSNKLDITYYYKSTLDFEMGVNRPSRIVFEGIDPSGTSIARLKVVLDIYLQTKTKKDLHKSAQMKLGIGCPLYLTKKHSSRYLVKDTVHYIAVENVVGHTKSSTRKEVSADEKMKLLSIKETSQGKTIRSIYDYKLRLVYELPDEGECSMKPMDLTAPGLMNARKFRLIYFLDLSYDFINIGVVDFKNQLGKAVDAREVVLYNQTLKSGRYDKVVRTIYSVQPDNADTNSGVILVGETVNAYNKQSNGRYDLVETTNIDYYDFGEKISEEEYHDRFKISDCFPYPGNRKTLKLKFEKENNEHSVHNKKSLYEYRNAVKTLLTRASISPSRIGDIEIIFDSDDVISYVTFLKLPRTLDVFKYDIKYVSPDIFSRSTVNTATDPLSCVNQNMRATTHFEALVYREQDKACAQVRSVADLVEDKEHGTRCSVFYFPFRNLHSYSLEPALESIRDRLTPLKLSMSVFEGFSDKHQEYTLTLIEEQNHLESESRQLYQREDGWFKLAQDDTHTLKAGNVANLGACYQACADFEENECETFSFCQKGGKVECLLSTSIYPNVTDKRIEDQDCRIYRKNRLNDYVAIKGKKYKHPTSIAVNAWVNDCADLCFASDECFSFQSCSYDCTFGGYVTDESTVTYSRCDIYIPKATHKYARNDKIVTETFQTVLNVNQDQCATICSDSNQGNEVCVSFNYCPGGKSASSCSLSKYSVKNPSTKTSVSDVCSNYEKKEDKSGRKKKRDTNSFEHRTSGGAAFGIIVLFISVGLVVGFIGPAVYNKTKSLLNSVNSGENDFTWSRQTDEVKEDQSSI